jgi:FkbM family methyltransferase
VKIFLDVGANNGGTARAVITPRYKFDKIVCFEPVIECIPNIESIGDSRIIPEPFGLWSETKKTILFGVGSGASVFGDKTTGNLTERREIQLIKTSDWISKNVKSNDVVFMKLNCEGSECEIIDDLIDSGEISKIYSIMIDFDVRKIPSKMHREFETRKKLRENKIGNVCFCNDVMIGESHDARIHNWLDKVGAFEELSFFDMKKKYAKTLPVLSIKRRRFGRVRVFCKRHFGRSKLYDFLKSSLNWVKYWRIKERSKIKPKLSATDNLRLIGKRFVAVHGGINLRDSNTSGAITCRIDRGEELEASGKMIKKTLWGKKHILYGIYIVKDGIADKSKIFLISKETIKEKSLFA